MKRIRWLGYLAAISFGSFLLGRLLPYRWFDPERVPFRSFSWEQGGRIYVRLGLPSWQKKVPDMSRIFPGLMPAKRMEKPTAERLDIMIRETCIAETVHLVLAAAGLGGLLFWHSPTAVCLTVLYSLGNLPFVMIQRYNRPRLMRLRAKMTARTRQSTAGTV